MLFRYRIRQQVQRSQQSRKRKKRLVYQSLGDTVAGNTVLLQGDGLKDRNALFYSYGTA